MGRLSNKVALITGGAGGIGSVIGTLFAEEGATVNISDINEYQGKKVVDEINSRGGKAVFMKLDVTSVENWKEVVRNAINLFGRVDILVNTAGILISKSIEEMSPEEWDKVIKVNLYGTFYGCKYILPAMKKSKGGSIINIGSIMGIVAFPNEVSYDASKGAIRMLTKAIAIEYGKYNIRVNCLHPGNTSTPMNEPWIKDPKKSEEILRPQIIKRWADPIEIAYGALFLASDESSFMTGSDLIIDGGYTAT